MIEFKRCFPEANSFDKVLKLKPLTEWKTDYVQLANGIGYWITESPFYDNGFEIFKNLISTFPIQNDNNSEHSVAPNPFDSIHLPEWAYKDLCFMIRDFYLKNFNPSFIEPQIHEWGNVYYKSLSKPISCWRIPHIDYHYGMVANMWFTDHAVEDSSTKFYKYHGKVYKDVYDFQVDTNHAMHEEWRSMSENLSRADSWFNLDDSKLKLWGFEYLGEAPTKYDTMTMYKANVCHTAHVSSNVDFRWSHAFAFSHLNRNDITMKDIFK